MEGISLGAAEGTDEGTKEGTPEGIPLGTAEGIPLGTAEGFSDGATDGCFEMVGAGVILPMIVVTKVGKAVLLPIGERLGCSTG